MAELLQEAMAPVNIVYTGLLMLVLIYWLSVIIGALDMGFFDFDFDFDADVDVDLDVDAGAGGSGGWLVGALQFFNFGKLPFMTIFAVLTICMWSFSILLNHYFGNGSVLFALAILFPMLFVSLIITKVVTTPLIPLFKDVDGMKEIDYVGMVCKLRTALSVGKLGQAELNAYDSIIFINVMLPSDATTNLAIDDEALIIGKVEEEDYYLIGQLKSI